MTVSGRLVVTGHDAHGAAIVLDDAIVPAAELAGQSVTARFFGGRDAVAHFPEQALPAIGDGLPLPGGWRCSTLTIAPGGNQAYRRFVADALGPLADAVHAGFHKTPTADLVFVLSGAMRLELDGTEERVLAMGDMAVLNGVRHRWSNASDAEATLLCLMTGAHHAAPAPTAPVQPHTLS